jgi:hypothetical protein
MDYLEQKTIWMFWTGDNAMSDNRKGAYEASDLPDEHPRKWIHGWNTTQGWEENIRKFTV